METIFRGLAECGLPLITPDDPDFAVIADAIRSRSPFARSPFAHRFPQSDAWPQAVLVNQSGNTVIALSVLYLMTNAEGHTATSRLSGLKSPHLFDFLTGTQPLSPEIPGFIFPGSKRLITETGIWGDNTDVIPPDPDRRGGAGAGFGGGRRSITEPVRVEIQIDVAVFEDGTCVGPDEYRNVDHLIEDLANQRDLATQVIHAFDRGASRGEVFEILRPYARRSPPLFPPAGGRMAGGDSFARIAIQELIDFENDDALRRIFERAARPLAIELRCP